MSAPAASNPQPDVDLIHKWLDVLYANYDPGQWLSLFAVDRHKNRDDRFRSVEWGRTGHHRQLARTIAAKAETCDVWLGVGTRRTNLGGSRGGDRNTLQVPGVWCDVDIAGPGHSDDRYPRDLAAALALVATFPLPPTAIIHTGGGIQPWWLFDSPVDADEAAPLLARWAHRWQEQARIAGVTIDSVWDLSRVLRVPGTLNRKLDLPRPVTPLPATPTARYTVEDIQELCPDPPAATITPLHRAGQPYHGPERPGDHFNRLHTCQDVLASTGQFTPAGKARNGEQHYHYQGAANQTSLVVYDDGHAAIYSSTAARQLPGAATRHAYDPYGLFSLLHHGGDHSAAASQLRRLGYGARNDPGCDWITDQTKETTVDPSEPWPDPDPWATPQPVDNTGPPPAWPVHTLPPWIADHCNTVAERIQVPVDLTCQQALACLATVVMGRLKARITDMWTETLNLYLVTSIDSGGGKSPADRHITGALVDLEQQLVDDAQHALKVDRLRRQKAEGHHEQTLKSYKAGKASEAEMIDAQYGLDAAPEPVEPRLLADDATPEALTGIMAEHQGRMAIISTEAALFDIVCGAYSDGKTVNLDIYLKGWGGERIDVQRKGTGRTHIKAALLTVGLTVQPYALNQLRGTKALGGRGFIPRFMFAIPANLAGWRDTDKQMDDTPLSTTDAWVTGLRRMWGDATRHEGTDVTFSAEARTLIGTWQAALEVRLRDGGDLHEMAPWCSKMKGSVIRTAALLHLADGGVGTPVPAGTFARAAEIGDYWIAQAHRVETIATGGLAVEAAAILKWIGGLEEPQFAGRDLLHGRGKKADEVYDALELLVERGWIRVREGHRLADLGRRGAPSPVFDAHPNLVSERMRVKDVVRGVQRVQRDPLVGIFTTPPPYPQPSAENVEKTSTPPKPVYTLYTTPNQDASQPPPTQPIPSGSLLFGPDPDDQGDPG